MIRILSIAAVLSALMAGAMFDQLNGGDKVYQHAAKIHKNEK